MSKISIFKSNTSRPTVTLSYNDANTPDLTSEETIQNLPNLE